jgi:probable F420-dependent oxidoreductase
MLLDAGLAPGSLTDVPAYAQAAEAIGFDAVWSSETQHDPFLPLALVAEHTQRLRFGTAVAIGFARSPTVVAHTAWDLAGAFGGRLLLGLGTQVRAHIERRFGMTWPESPAGQLREYIAALRAVWNTWQTGERLNLRGDRYKLTLMTPFFSPGPIERPAIPIYIAGVNRALCRLAGEAADGFHVHPYHSVRYLRQVVLPAIEDGRRLAGRPEGAVDVAVSAFAATDEAEIAFARSQIAFYASTPSYRGVMDVHGWGAAADELTTLARRGAWAEMGSIVNDEMLHTFATIAPAEELASALKSRYAGIADRLTLYLPFRPGERDGFWRRLVEDLRD